MFEDLKWCDGLEHLEDEVQTRNSGYLCRCATKQTRVESVKGSQAFSHFPGDVSGVALGGDLPRLPAFVLPKENRPQPCVNCRPEEAKPMGISRE